MCIFSFFFLTLTYLNKKNKHGQKCEVVVIRSAGLVVPNSRVSYSQSLTPLVDADGMKTFYYYILLLCGYFEIGPSPFLCRWRVKQYRKVVRSPRPGQACVSLSGYFNRFVRISPHLAAWLKSVTPSSGLRTVRGRIT